MTWALAACLGAGAVAVGWPTTPARRRLAARRPIGAARLRAVCVVFVTQRPNRILACGITAAAATGWVAGGPVAACITAVYTGLAGRALVRRAMRRRAAAARTTALDVLAALAADLRAGMVAARTPETPADGRIGELTASVWRLAERTGAPAADLVERIEADARAAGRATASAAAQAAGAQATALLLAALPLGGIALGVAIGADPVHVLLHTPIGATCALVAALLQVGGLMWADRLVRGAVR